MVESEEEEKVEQSFVTAVFIHGRNIEGDERMSTKPDPKDVHSGKYPSFDVLINDACADYTSVISLRQFNKYYQTFNLPHFIHPTDNRISAGVGGESKATVLLVMKLPFKKLCVVIDVIFLARKVHPTIL